jgi:hypothetical protein
VFARVIARYSKLSFVVSLCKTVLWPNWRTDSLEQSPSWEANGPSASQEILRILWNQTVYTESVRAHHLSLSRPRPVQFMPPHCIPWEIHFDGSLPSTPGSSKRFLSPRFPYQNLVCNSPLPLRATCPAHLILLDLITRIIFGEECCLATGMRNFSIPSSVLSSW